jgi:PKD repeat protein
MRKLILLICISASQSCLGQLENSGIISNKVVINNIIYNGDFSLGNNGFTSQYYYTANNTTEGEYYVGKNPANWYYLHFPCTDHTSADGRMLLVNGSPEKNTEIWKTDVTVTPGSTYEFSLWICSISKPNPAELSLSINGENVGELIKAGLPVCKWTKYTAKWKAGKKKIAQLVLLNKNTVEYGNDFALDDISLAEQGPNPPCAGNKPSATFTYNITNCFEVQFRLKQKNNDIKSIKWFFGDGSSSVETSSSHIYKKPGAYKVKAIVINKAGCADTVTNEIKLQALNTDFVFTEYGEPGQIHFKAKNNKASYNWNFDDGQTIENETAISHTFTQTSTFKVNMYAKNSLGCTDTVSKYVNINLPNLITDSIAAPLATPVIAEAIAPSTTLLEKREKEILENIIVNTDSLLVSVYDNGIIDGDSVTLIFNDKIIAVHQLLSSKPYTFAIVLDKNLPANELMMYAENLGSIPPNTSLIIINDGPVKHQLNISSNKKTNGTISFTLKNKNNSR